MKQNTGIVGWRKLSGEFKDGLLIRFRWSEGQAWAYQQINSFNKHHFYLGKEIEYLDETPITSEENEIVAQVKALKNSTNKACISKEAALKYLQDAGIIEANPPEIRVIKTCQQKGKWVQDQNDDGTWNRSATFVPDEPFPLDKVKQVEEERDAFAVGLIGWITRECAKGNLRNHTNGDFRDDKVHKHYSYREVVDLYKQSIS